jgi:hypothetical protein
MRPEMESDRQPDDELLDTGMPPGVHPNSDVPDPEVVKRAEEQAAARERETGEGDQEAAHPSGG